MQPLPEARVVRDDSTSAATGRPPSRMLGVPPRHVPTRITWRLLFGGAWATSGWVFAVFGMIFVLAFLPFTELRGADFDRTAAATITRIEATNSKENDQRIYRVYYSFADERGRVQIGSSYTRELPMMGAARPVEYDSVDPSHSRLEGMRTKPFGGWVVLLTLVFPVMGLAIALPQMRSGLMARRLLRYGVVTRGKLLKKEATNVSVDEGPVMALTFEYELAPGTATCQVVIKTHKTEKLEDEPLEPMLYDPFDPARATTLDNLPGSPRIGDDGRLETRPGLVALLLPIMPAIFVIELASGVVFWVAG